MIVAQLSAYIGRFCAVTTLHGVYYGDFLRLSGVIFAVRPRFECTTTGRVVGANDIVEITALNDPR